MFKAKSELSIQSKALTNKPRIFGRKLEDVCNETMFSDKLLIPAIVRDITLYLEYSGALEEEGIYRISGIKSKVESLKKYYDNHTIVNLNDFETSVLASTLKFYFRMLPEPILPLNENLANYNLLEDYFLNIPLANYQTINWLFGHLKLVSSKAKINKMSVTNLSIVFSPTLNITNDMFIYILQNYDNLFPTIRPNNNGILSHITISKTIDPQSEDYDEIKDFSKSAYLITTDPTDSDDIYDLYWSTNEFSQDSSNYGTHSISYPLKDKESIVNEINEFDDRLNNDTVSIKMEIQTENKKINELKVKLNFLNRYAEDYTRLLHDDEHNINPSIHRKKYRRA